MRVLHEGETLAADVDVADTTLARARGLMFHRSIPDDYALVFRFDEVARRAVHMLFVPFPLDVVWLVDGRVERVARLGAWLGIASARADVMIELPAGAAARVEPGDHVHVEAEAASVDSDQ